MTNYQEIMLAELKGAREIVEKAQSESREFTEDERRLVGGHLSKHEAAKEDWQRAQGDKALEKRLGDLGREVTQDQPEGKSPPPADSLGAHFLAHAGAQLKAMRGTRFSIGAPDYDIKAAVTRGGLTDITTRPGAVTLPLRRPVVADLLMQGTLSGTTLQYFVEGAVTGAPATVAENAPKPELSGGFTAATETLTKLAGWTKESDELVEDFSALASIVSERLVTRLGIVEETQILSGDGTPPNLRGILNRSGIITIAVGTATGATAVFKAMTAIQLATFSPADFLVVHPTDYERERLRADLNGQYLGGGPFMGPYGVGGVAVQPSLWGLATVVTPAITAGTALVGSRTAAQVFRKGGVRVDTTNTDQDDFINNRITVRAEERLLLAVYYPAGFCTVTMS